MTEAFMRDQIEQAAMGCISGTGAEWPHLLASLRHYGEHPEKFMTAETLKVMAQRVCEKKGW